MFVISYASEVDAFGAPFPLAPNTKIHTDGFLSPMPVSLSLRVVNGHRSMLGVRLTGSAKESTSLGTAPKLMTGGS